MKVYKYQALGNDYIVFDGEFPENLNHQRFIKSLCDRNFGVGSDGVLWRNHNQPFGLRIFNPDGSEAEKSGNGLRIFAKYCLDYLNAPNQFTINLPSTKVLATSKNKTHNLIEIEMGSPTFKSVEVGVLTDEQEYFQKPLLVEEKEMMAHTVSVGNPHCVFIVDNLAPQLAKKIGPLVENHPIFKNRTNVQFAKQLDKENIKIEIWERGAGYTLASGTSSCAVASVFKKLNLIENKVNILMQGGKIEIRFEEENIFMTGEVNAVFMAELSSEFLKSIE